MKLVILDRDGVINEDSAQFIKSPDEWRPISGSLDAIAKLNHYGFRVVIATNQSGVGRGLFDMDMLNAIHDKMLRAIGQAGGRVDGIFFCPHAADSTCDCRKPKPGMLVDISQRFNVSLKGVAVIGDALRDLEAAVSVGAQPLLVLTGKGQRTRVNPLLPAETLVFPDLAAAVQHITK